MARGEGDSVKASRVRIAIRAVRDVLELVGVVRVNNTSALLIGEVGKGVFEHLVSGAVEAARRVTKASTNVAVVGDLRGDVVRETDAQIAALLRATTLPVVVAASLPLWS